MPKKQNKILINHFNLNNKKNKKEKFRQMNNKII
jgi:hypothetical protein